MHSIRPATYSISIDIKPGQAGKQTGGSSGHFDGEGTLIDWNTLRATPAGSRQR
jgi:hypothetical protein